MYTQRLRDEDESNERDGGARSRGGGNNNTYFTITNSI